MELQKEHRADERKKRKISPNLALMTSLSVIGRGHFR